MADRDTQADESETYYGVVTTTEGTEAFTFARLGSDNAVFHEKEDAIEARQDLIEEYGHEEFHVRRVEVTPVET